MALATLKTSKLIVAEPLTPELFAQFGGVISSAHQLDTAQRSSANYGTATKLFKLSPVENNYAHAPSGKPATANWNLFQCRPPLHLIKDGRYVSKVLERHPFSTQTFLPMGRSSDEVAYMVIVAPTLRDKNGLPDLEGVRAFTCKGNQAVTYGAATWHAPMIALGAETDFAVLIHENGVPAEDCEEVYLDTLDVEFTTESTDVQPRKPQSEEAFQTQLDDFHGKEPLSTRDLKAKAEQLYYERKYDEVVALLDDHIGDSKGKLGEELMDIRRHSLQKLS